MRIRIACAMVALTVTPPTDVRAQDRGWVADVGFGVAGFADDSTKNYPMLGGSLRKYMTPRVSIGPEAVFMSNSDHVRDRNVMLTGNVVYDLAARDRQVAPFLVAGGGIGWGRDQVRNGPYWSRDPAFSAGGGVRVRATTALSAAVEYRVGSELHQRISGSAGFHW